MPDPQKPPVGFDRNALAAELAEASRALDMLADGPARAAADVLRDSIAEATRAARTELQALVKTGEADIDRLGRALAEALARAAISQVAGGNLGSNNQIVALIAQAVRRGVRFT